LLNPIQLVYREGANYEGFSGYCWLIIICVQTWMKTLTGPMCGQTTSWCSILADGWLLYVLPGPTPTAEAWNHHHGNASNRVTSSYISLCSINELTVIETRAISHVSFSSVFSRP